MKVLARRVWEEPAIFIGLLGALAGTLAVVLELPALAAAVPVLTGALTRQFVTPAGPPSEDVPPGGEDIV